LSMRLIGWLIDELPDVAMPTQFSDQSTQHLTMQRRKTQPSPTTGFHPQTAVLLADDGQPQQLEQTHEQRQVQRLLHLHDVGGAEAIRGIWPSYYHDAHGLVWVTAGGDLVRGFGKWGANRLED
jgi:hypothetical protein